MKAKDFYEFCFRRSIMTFETLTLNGARITAPDMHGKPSRELTPFAVRGPNFVELNDGTILYFLV